MDNIFGPAGILASHLKGYESRPDQLAMAEAVAQLLAQQHEDGDGCASLVIEAATGLGKTLAYLIPAVLSGNRVVVSTNTRNLQDQILEHEIPLIQNLLAPDLKALCVKGRQNYLCLYRWRQLLAAPHQDVLSDQIQQKLDGWIEQTVHADRSELPWMAGSSPLWQKICCLSHFCLGGSCPEGTGCFLNRLRRDAAASTLLIVNHHLLFSDLAVRKSGFGEVLPRYESVIFDEAHHIENVATTFFGVTFSRHQLLDLAGDVTRSAEAELPGQDSIALQQAAARLAQSAELLSAAFPPETGRLLLDEQTLASGKCGAMRDAVAAALNALVTALDKIIAQEGPWQQYAERAAELEHRLHLILAERYDDLTEEDIRFTYWYERTERNLTLHATPIDIAEELQATLFATAAHCVFTSATLTTDHSFDYYLKRLGLSGDTPALSLASPFDYASQTRIYIPSLDFPEPYGQEYHRTLHRTMEQLIGFAQGRTLALFTSYQAMELARAYFHERLPYPLLVQGEASRRTLLEQFSKQTDSVLFAVASFWEGVDVPGESLSLVLIDKLPFEVPSDPVIMARSNRIKVLGGNPFTSFQVPRAILALRQGVGRLMRTSEDRGVIAILDTRLYTKGYGRRFLRSLPPSPIVRTLDDVAAFFASQG